MRKYKVHECIYKGIKLKIGIYTANDKEIKYGHKYFILKLQDGIVHESNVLHDVESITLNYDDFDDYLAWHRVLPLDKQKLICKYPCDDFLQVVAKALDSVGIDSNSKMGSDLIWYLCMYNNSGFYKNTPRDNEIRVKAMESDEKFLNSLREFSNRYFLR